MNNLENGYADSYGSGEADRRAELFDPTSEFVAALHREMQNAKKDAWQRFNEAIERDHERQIQREQAFWERHRLARAGDLQVGMTVVERKGKKTYKNKIRNVTIFGKLDRYRRVELYGTRILWSYHIDDEVLVEA